MESFRGSVIRAVVLVVVVVEVEIVSGFAPDDVGGGPDTKSMKGLKRGGKPNAARALSSVGSCGTGAGGRPVVE